MYMKLILIKNIPKFFQIDSNILKIKLNMKNLQKFLYMKKLMIKKTKKSY